MSIQKIIFLIARKHFSFVNCFLGRGHKLQVLNEALFLSGWNKLALFYLNKMQQSQVCI